MELIDAIKARHSVRKYSDKPIEVAKVATTHIDLGIVKYHFEIGAGKENFSWQ